MPQISTSTCEEAEKYNACCRIRRRKYLLVRPQEGQYSLELFTREKWENKMVDCFECPINCNV